MTGAGAQEESVDDIVADKEHDSLHLLNMSGKEEHDRVRPLSYPDTDCVILCFSIDSPATLENISETWAPEIKHFCPNVPIILVGNKTDLRENGNWAERAEELVKKKDGFAMAKTINAIAYMECSVKNEEGVKEIFETVAKHQHQRKVVTRMLHLSSGHWAALCCCSCCLGCGYFIQKMFTKCCKR